MSGMGRREFVALLGGAAAAWPLPAQAQQGKGPVRLGFLPLGSPSNAYDRSLVEAFQEGLRRVGLIGNRDIILDVGWTSGNSDQAVKRSVAARRGTVDTMRLECIGSGQTPNVDHSHHLPQRR
jgi:putative ABC transport system substrate-binding protein